MGEKIITGNHFDKYNSKNPLYKKLMTNFMDTILDFIRMQKFETNNILETGCGEGYLGEFILENIKNVTYQAFDIDKNIVNTAKLTCPKSNITVGSIYDLSDYSDKKFEFTITSEVLEHLEEPERALEELQKLQTEYYIFTVPKEPVWRFLNVLRLKYLKDFGNTPGHLQHWNKKSFRKMIAPYFDIVEFKVVFPWLMALCKKKVAITKYDL